MIGSICISIRTIGIRTHACRASSYNAASTEDAGLGRCGNRGLAVIRGRQQRMIRAGSVLMLGLEGRRRSVLFVRRSLFGRRRLSHSAAGAAVIAAAVDRRIVVDDGGFVGVVDDSGVYVRDGCIVAVHTAVPRAAAKAHSGVT